MKTMPDPLQDPRFRDVVVRLRAQAAPEPAAGFTDRTLARLRRPEPARASLAGYAMRAAAVLALLLGGTGIWFLRPVPPAAPAGPAPLALLLATQRPDGGWSADEQGLRPRYDLGVTALALLALMQAGDNPPADLRAQSIRAGVRHLIGRQNADGSFGAESAAPPGATYLAAMALQAAAQLPEADAAWRAAAARARRHRPSDLQMAKFNARLARPAAFPSRWADAGGPATLAALRILARPPACPAPASSPHSLRLL